MTLTQKSNGSKRLISFGQFNPDSNSVFNKAVNANINIKDLKKGINPLIAASGSGNLDTIKLFGQAGLDINDYIAGNSALIYAWRLKDTLMLQNIFRERQTSITPIIWVKPRLLLRPLTIKIKQRNF
ncbi:MAG: hypothetical protein MZV70_70155 [Desulfobacterales bacterium]|nr:hypothetical protein [Desulfobacterales bacterium]